MLRIFITIGCLAAAMIVTPAADAQQLTPEFTSNVQPTLPANELLLGQIRDAMPTTELDRMTVQTLDALTTGEDLEQQLSLALAVAPDDAARSRVEAVRTHTTAALDALRLAKVEPTLDAARARLEQAWGEAHEGLDELRPFILGMVASGELTGK
jgi:hypothetical protein